MLVAKRMLILCVVWAIAPAYADRASGQIPSPAVGIHRLSRLPMDTEADERVLNAGPTPANLPFVDLDGLIGEPKYQPQPIEAWSWQVLPEGIIFPSYLAGTKEPRFAAHLINVRNDGFLMDAALGSRVGLLRLGNRDPIHPEGWQVDAEGAAQVRLDIPEEVDVRSVDFRAGLPITWGAGPYRFKFGYYHLSSHVGDEFLLKNPGFPRLNFSRDVLLVGHMFYLTPRLKIYGEAGWAFKREVTEPWEFQFGVDYAPCGPTGFAGAPFFALNGQLREELNFGGAVTAQAGWAWRGLTDTRMLRIGVHYFNGESNQYSFFDNHEEQIGMGVWYDF